MVTLQRDHGPLIRGLLSRYNVTIVPLQRDHQVLVSKTVSSYANPP